MTINAANNNPRVEYTVAEGVETTQFSIPFEFFEDPEVKLYVDGTLRTQGSGDGNYTVTGGEGSTGTATFNTVSSGTQPVTGISGGSTVIIVRDIPIERVTDFSAGADINRAALNTQLDTLTALVSDADTNITRSLTAPITDVDDSNGAVDMSLPNKATRAGKALGFNSSTGNPEAITFYDSAADVRAAVEAASDSNVFTDADHSKLDGIEANATADQSAAEILTAVKAVDGASSGLDADLLDGQHGSYYTTYADNAVSNLVDSAPSSLDTLNELAAALNDDANFSTTVTNSIATKLPLAGGTMTGNIVMSGAETVDGRDLSVDGAKLDGIEDNATADQTAAEIRTLVESASDSNVFTDADHTKLNAIEANATADQTASEIRTLVESATDSNVFTDADHTKLNGIEDNATADQTASEILTAVKTVDGVGSGLNADLLDGQHGSHYETNTTNVTAAGALMDSEVANLAEVKAFDSSDYATATQGSTADAAMPKAGGTFTGDVTIEDNEKLHFGDGQDLSIHHYVDNWIASNNGDLHIRQEAVDKDVKIQADNANGHAVDYFQADGSTGEVILSHFGYPKIKTKSTGADITGDITVSGTVDGVDIAARDAVLTSTTTTADAAMPKSGGTFTGDVTLLNSGDGSLASPYLKLKRDSASPAAWDYLGIIRFLGEDGASNETPYSTILGRIVDPTSGSEDGRIEIHQMKAGTETLTYVFDHDKFQLTNEQPLRWYNHNGSFDVDLTAATPTVNRTITLPDQSGTAMLWQSAWPDDPTENSIAIGNNALINANSSAIRNTVVGADAGDAITSGERNSLIGDNAGSLLTTGGFCTAVGQNAMGHNTTDSSTTAIGAQAGGGDFLNGGTYVGSYAGNYNSNHKDYQVAIGYNAMDDCTGDYSTAVGAFSMSDGYHYRSVAVGYDALGISTSNNAYYNTAVGAYTGGSVSWGDGNTLIGYAANVLNGGTNYAVAIGYGADAAGSYSVSIGNNASASSYNGGSAYCVNIGNYAGYDLDGGDYCTFVGDQAGYSGGTGNYNTSVGFLSLYQLTSGTRNAALGNNCLQQTDRKSVV